MRCVRVIAGVIAVCAVTAEPTQAFTLVAERVSCTGFEVTAGPGATAGTGSLAPREYPLATPAATVDDAGAGGLIAQRGMVNPRRQRRARADSAVVDTAKREAARERRPGRALPIALSPERARIMLQSLTMPGWGQATMGQRRTAGLFALVEAGVWGSFAAFRVQERMRRDTYENTASLFAGVSLEGRDEEFRRIVGFYASSEEYNRLVVRRDAANLYYGDPAAYAAYIAEHELKGADAWSWQNEESLLRYRQERQQAQRAAQRAHTAIAAAIINRLVSVVHAARGAGHPAGGQTSWSLECAPAGGADPTAVRLGVRADF